MAKSEEDKIVLYEPLLSFKYHKIFKNKEDCYITSCGLGGGWEKNDLIDKIFEEGIDPDEFKQTVEQNFLEFLKNKNKGS